MNERVRGGLYGLLIGDAVGVPYEFHTADTLPPRELLDMVPPPGFRRAHGGTPPGTWSDDGAQALALLDSLLSRGRMDPEDLAARMLRWRDHGAYTPDGVVFDVGIITANALRAVAEGVPAEQAGPTGERSNGNGSLMRVLPLALWHRGSDAALVADAERQSRITHGHPRAAACCALYVLWARAELRGEPEAYGWALDRLRALYAEGDPRRVELEEHVVPERAPTGTGYVVDCLISARWACAGRDYEDVVRRAISLGIDTDTTACVAGGIAGIRWKEEGIPARWRAALKGRELVEGLLSRLV